jgi:hypothetical protein
MDTPLLPGISPSLSDEEQMLVLLRDELYEGNWDEFVRDLRDRLDGRPHIFDTAPASTRLQETIRSHLQMIDELRKFETRHRVNLGDRLPDARHDPNRS